MDSRITSRFISRLLQTRDPNLHHSIPRTLITPVPKFPQSNHLRHFSTARRSPTRSSKPDVGARARQMQNCRLWTYAISFSCIAGFIVIVLNQFKDQLVFYVTPTDALSKYTENPSKNKFRLGGLVLEGSVTHLANSHEIEFVVTDLITDLLIRYEGQVPDLFREGHSVVVEGFVKPITEQIKKEGIENGVSVKATNASYCPNISLESVRLSMLTVFKLHSCEGITSASMAAISHSYMLELDNCSLLTSVFLDLPHLQNIRLVHYRKFVDLSLRSVVLSSIKVSNGPSLQRINIVSTSQTVQLICILIPKHLN